MTQGFRLYRRLLGEARPYWAHIGGMVGLSVLASGFALLTPLPLKIAIDSAVGSHPLPGFISFFVPGDVTRSRTGTLIVASLLFVIIALLKQLQSFAQLGLTTYTGQRLLLHVRGRLFRRAEDLSLGYHDLRGVSDSSYRIQYDAESIQDVAVAGVIPFLTAALTIVGMIYITARIDWQLALVSAAMAPALFITFRIYRARLRGQWHESKRLESAALSVVQEALESLRVVKAFGQEDHECRRFTERSWRSASARLRLAVAEGWFGLAIGLIIGSAMAAVLFLGTRRVLAGSMTVGSLALVMGYLQELYSPLKTASKKAGDLQSSLASAERVYELLDEAPGLHEKADPIPLVRARGELEFEHVSFAYQRGTPVLHDVSFRIPVGARVGISGRTGAGKTTIVSLLTRFYDASSGEVLLDGVDIRDYRISDLRRQFAIVLQEPVLFSASIEENIAYARDDASVADIEAAARAANAHDFIARLPGGYSTQVGARGMRLSGGERQRVALARAFLKNAPILILDEPTSSIDTRTEAEIIDAMRRLMSRRTTIMIAHRLSTLDSCDVRLEVENGKLTVVDKVRSRAPGGRETAGFEKHGGRRDGFDEGRDARTRNAGLRSAALHAWRRTGASRAPCGGEIVRVRGTSIVCRLLGAGADGSAVLGKRASRDQVRVERAVHQQILSRLPMRSLRLYGCADDDDPSLAWLFIEDPGQAPSPALTAVARWLGRLHAGAAQLDTGALPGRLERDQLEGIRIARERLCVGLQNPALQPSDGRLIGSLVSLCTLAEARWPVLTQICARVRPTLVHGDVSTENLRAGPRGGIYAADWEFCSWGAPAADLHILDRRPAALRSYCEGLAEHGERPAAQQVQQLASLGRGLRLLAAIGWASLYLETAWPGRGIDRLRTYEAPLRAWLGEKAAA
jgi:ATP-binding cassette subfamily B protein